MKKYAVLSLIALVVTASLVWLSTHSFLDISARSTNAGGFTYEIKEQTAGKSTTIESSKNHVRKIVRNGQYQIVVSQKNNTGVIFAKTASFLRTKKVETSLQAENARTFVGKSPSFCMYYTNILYSYDCNSTYNTLKKHNPATVDTPTYTDNAPESEDSTLRSIFTIDQQSYTLTENGSGADESGVVKIISPLREDLTLSDGAIVGALNRYKNYTITPYKNGFIAYTDALDDVVSVQNASLSKTNITPISLSKSKATKPIEATVYENQLALTYNSEDTGSDTGLKDTDTEANITKGSSLAVVYTNEQNPKQYTFSKLYTSMRLCGKDLLCALNSQKLDVYNLKNTSKPLFSMSDVQDTTSVGSRVIIATSNKVYSIDPNTRSGYVQYSYGTYTYCGLKSTEDTYILCILDKDQVSNALLIDPGMPNIDNIDKKIETIGKLPQVTSWSIYGSIIHISQYTGEPVYDPTQNGYTNDPTKIQSATKRINEVIDQIGIDRTKYTIVFNY